MATDSSAHSLSSRDDAARQEFWACLALRECPGIAMRRIAALLSHFGSAYDAVRCLDAWRDAGVSAACAEEFKKETWRQKAKLEWALAGNSPCGIVLWSDSEYPSWLRSIADPPPFLYFFGDLSLLRNLAVAVVGLRSCSEEGLKATAHIAGGLAQAGITVVSGMAKGIDRAAHLAGLEGPGGSIGVLGAGIDVVYPKSNNDLYLRMREKGLLVSEYPPGHGIDARNFPVRNRIISGISRAVVVAEAAVRSGSLNTARHALEQNRELMAVPGPVTAASAKGCQELVRRGAKPVFCADDVLRELVPLLADHVREGFLSRDLERFRFRGPERKDSDGKADTGSAPEVSTDSGPSPRENPSRGCRRRGGKPEIVPAERTPEDAGKASPAASGVPDGLTDVEEAVYGLVRRAPMHIDDICRSLGRTAGEISRVAAMLEVRGHLARLPGMRYAIREWK